MDIQTAKRKIGKQLLQHTDGETMAAMHSHGLKYRANRGASVVELRRIAAVFGRWHELGQWLWEKTDFREMRILACMVLEPDKISVTEFHAMAEQLTTTELAEQGAINLFSRSEHALGLAREWVASPQPLVQGTGFVSFARYVLADRPLASVEIYRMLDTLRAPATEEALFVRRAKSQVLRALIRKYPAWRAAIGELARRLRSAENEAARFVGNEAHYELLYVAESNL